MDNLYGAEHTNNEPEREQCDFTELILDSHYHNVVGFVYCPSLKKMELSDDEGMAVGIFCPNHFFEMLRLRNENKMLRFN